MERQAVLRLALAGCSLALASAAPALQTQPQPQSQPQPEVAQPQHTGPAAEPVLGGPKVPDELVRTLVRRDAKGNFLRAEGRPEEAALALLGLKPDDREKARGVIGDRAARLCDSLFDHADRLREASDLIAAGKRDEAASIARAFWDEFEPDHAPAPMLYAMGQALGPAHEAELTRIVDEYWDAWITWELRRSRDKSEQARSRVRERLAFQLFQDELRQAYDRVIRPYRERVEQIFAALDPTPEQRASIRGAVVEFVRESRARPTPQQRREVLTKIYSILDQERRAKFFDLVARQLVEAQG